MPQKVIPKCVQCETLESPLWRNIENGHICHSCYEENKTNLKNELEPETEPNGNGEEKKLLRKSTRSTRYKAKLGTAQITSSGNGAAVGTPVGVVLNSTQPNPKTIPKGKSRRNIFKKHPCKAPTASATTSYVESIFYNGSYIQIGDIVSLTDHKDDTYYAQIRGILVDTYCEKSAFITWLIPTKSSSPHNERFDPSTYLIGPDEDFPRKLSCMDFIMHAPSDYYYNKNMPYPPPDTEDNSAATGGFIWTSMHDCAV